MALKLETLDANATLADLQTMISQQEALGYELVTLARGVMAGAPSNTATYRNRPNPPGPLTLAKVDGAQPLAAQQVAVSAGEAGKALVCYAAVLVEGNETNVAAYRG